MPLFEDKKLKNIEQGNISIPFFDEIRKLAKLHSVRVYFVGGCVRDMILGNNILDVDIVPFDIDYKKYADLLQRCIKAKKIIFKDNVRLIKKKFVIDISKPKGEDIYKDLTKRDFTINNLALTMEKEIIGLKEDIFNGIIKAVYPESFHDDPLRMLRGVRFISVFDFELDDFTYRLLCKNKSFIKQPSKERVYDELYKITSGNNFIKAINVLVKSELLFEIIPKLTSLKQYEINIEKAPINIVAIMISSLEKTDKITIENKFSTNRRFVLIFATIFNYLLKYSALMSSEKIIQIMSTLKFPGKTIKQISAIINNMKEFWQLMDLDNKDKLLRYIYDHYDYMGDIIIIASNDISESFRGINKIKQFINEVTSIVGGFKIKHKCYVTGKDLLCLGVPEGPQIGRILYKLHFMLVTDRLHDKCSAIKYFKQNMRGKIT